VMGCALQGRDVAGYHAMVVVWGVYSFLGLVSAYQTRMNQVIPSNLARN